MIAKIIFNRSFNLSLLIIFSISTVYAQNSTGVLQGTVTDENKAIIPEARLVLRDGGTFDPTTGLNFEVGAKYDLLKHRANLTFALFQNQIDNTLVQTDAGVFNANNSRYYVAAGTRRSRGAEMTGELQLAAGFTHFGGREFSRRDL